MAILNTVISATTDGTYGMCNNLIGQIKTALLNDPNVSVISDNNPATNAEARTLVFTVAGQDHYMKITASASTTLAFYGMKLDHTTNADSGQAMSFTSTYPYTIRMLYSAKIHAFQIWQSTSTKVGYLYINCDDPSGWYQVVGYASSSPRVYTQGSDYAGSLSSPTYNILTVDNKVVGIPVRFALSDKLSNYCSNNFTDCGALTIYGFFTDAQNNNYLSLNVCGNYFLVSDITV
jgi:hypothetical protein